MGKVGELARVRRVSYDESEGKESPLSVEVLPQDPGSLAFVVAGTAIAGEFRCADCGYGAIVQRVLPRCPMCGGTIWESRDVPAAPAAD
jgi:rubrerythrin